ncbi:hypothetical protein [Streptomyces avidinii]|uniref:Uncharacterized protein n=1 Tax=Streptomyces avidinii TaxID=1895 RepID=A0ABS4KW62_STRAV|nr:hypothetical protein [Streptomyces avidinii]MBP2034240.1 hypothetical protein [Streptomyces avidinii]GGZ35184.1 hypothetical protein GCM10010343_73070 [Streptomyces avidinii]
MSRSSRKQRFALVAVSAAFVGAGVLVPSSAFASSAPSSVSEVATMTASHIDLAKGDRGGHGDHHKKGDKHKKNKNKGKPKDVKNMPGCKFYKGKVYCEHKPNPAPAPAPKPAPAPAPGG